MYVEIVERRSGALLHSDKVHVDNVKVRGIQWNRLMKVIVVVIV